jgi:hypothetical protein
VLRVTDRIRLLSLAGLTVVVLAGCGSSTPSATGISALLTSGSTTGGPGVQQTTDATAERDKLLKLARPGTSVTAQGTVPGWPPANGSGIPATPSELSGFGFVADKAQNLEYMSFAVFDSAGRCAGGDLEANSAGTQITSARPVAIPAKAPCTGDEVAKLAGHG